MSALTRRLLGPRLEARLGGEGARFFCLAPIGVLAITPCIRALWEGLYLFVFPNRLDKSRLGLGRIELLGALHAQYHQGKGRQRGGYVAPTDALDAVHRALYKQQAAAMLLLVLATLALALPKPGARRE